MKPKQVIPIGVNWHHKGVWQLVSQFIMVFKTRLLDMDTQTQHSDIHVQDMDKLRTYKLLIHYFGCEEYMFCIVNRMFRTAFSRFRGGLLALACNEGRYNNTPFAERLCPFVNAILKQNIISFWYVQI